jgi:hypothetical protein
MNTLPFDGETFVPALDGARLTAQYEKVFNLMSDSGWRTLDEISKATVSPPASVSARLRDMRKEKFGGHTVNRDRLDNGLFRYQLIVRA